MNVANREAQILRIQKASFRETPLPKELEERIKGRVKQVVQATLEESLIAEVEQEREHMIPKPRRSGYYGREVNTLYGGLVDVQVPKLRSRNKERRWKILNRYQRSLRGVLDYACYLYIMGLSLRDLQEAFYFLFGKVLSRSAINQVTLKVQQKMELEFVTSIKNTPPILIIDGVWVNIQYTLDGFKVDQAGHRRQKRKAEERVILTAMAVWPDGSYNILHFQIAETESQATWTNFWQTMIDRGLQAKEVQLVVSDGAHGVPSSMRTCLPNAQQQRCITHKVRGLKPNMTYDQLELVDSSGQLLSTFEAKQARWKLFRKEAHDIFNARSFREAQEKLAAFSTKWSSLESKAVKNLKWGIKRNFVFYQFPPDLFVHIRTTNHLERFFRTFRNKADEIGSFPNETTCLTLFYLIMLRDHSKLDRLDVANN